MGTHNFIQEHIDVGVNSIKAAKSIAGKDQKTLQAIVGILFDGCVDELYSFTDCSYSNNPLEPFYEYLPK